MRGIKLEKSHIHILESETLSRESKVTESHKRLSIQSLIIANYRTMSTICQQLYTFGVEVYFTRMWRFYLEVV